VNNRNAQDLTQALTECGATVKGKEVKCPFHQDNKPSGWMKAGEDGIWRFTCHSAGCGFNGDLYDVLARSTGRPLNEILQEYSEKHNEPRSTAAKTKPPTPPTARAQGTFYPTVTSLTQALGSKVQMGPWLYKNALGAPYLCVFRILSNGHKAYPQARPCEGGWEFAGAKPPYPIYNLAAVTAADRIVIVEGEKCAEALIALGITATTSAGGAGKAHLTDWSPLTGKKVWLWPDNDPENPETHIRPGYKHMEDVAKLLNALPKRPTIRQIDPVALDMPPKGDVADFIAEYKAHGTNDPTIRAVCNDILDDADILGPALEVKTLIEDIIIGKHRSIPFPWSRLSNLSKALLPGTVTIICGDPGGSKSFFLTQCLAHWHELNYRVAVYELEDDRKYHLQRCLAQRCKRANLFDDGWIHAFPELARQYYTENEAWLNDFGASIHEAPNESTHLRKITEWIMAQVAAGIDIICVDPITAAAKSDKSWNDDLEFITTTKAAIRQTGARLVLITHPKKGSKAAVGMDELSGGAAYQRLAQTILWIESLPYGKKLKIARKGDQGQAWVDEVECNRILHCTKTRNGPGHGLSIGYKFIGKQLLFEEIGLISYKNKDPSDYSVDAPPPKPKKIEPPQPELPQELF
jgi:hypothetical protein